jgi:hypothetical protein
MTAIASPLTRRPRATALDRMLLQASRGLELFAVARIERRAATTNPVTEKARADADERRRTAQALGSLGILPR